MYHYVLGPHTYVCETDDGAIFLELSSRRYFAINEAQAKALRSLIVGWPSQSPTGEPPVRPVKNDASLVEALLSIGVVSRSDRVPNRALTYPKATNSFSRWQSNSTPVRFRHLLRFIMCLISVVAIYKLGKLKYLVRRLERVHACQTPSEDFKIELMHSLLNCFFLLRPWFYTAYNNCLLDSLVLSYFLADSAVPCRLIIGVSTKPFRADAWVQCGDLVINSYVEDVQVYTPILTA
jgi:hypothetical protein